MQIKKINCNICNAKQFKNLYVKRGFNIVKCSCGLVYVNPQPTQKELKKFYNRKYSVPFNETKESVKNKAYKILNKLGDARGSLLEIGCSYGFFLDEARKKGWRVKGVEISKEASNYARKKLTLDVFSGTIENASLFLKNQKFETIIMLDVLEHLIDPKNSLKILKNSMKKNGLLYLTTPNINSLASKINKQYWQWLSPPAHLFYFSPETIIELLKRSGLKVVSIETFKGDANNLILETIKGIILKIGLLKLFSSGDKIKTTNANKQKKRFKKPYKILNKLTICPYILLTPLIKILSKKNLGETMLVCVQNTSSS